MMDYDETPFSDRSDRLPSKEFDPKSCRVGAEHPPSPQEPLFDADFLIKELFSTVIKKCPHASAEEKDILLENIEVAVVEARDAVRLKQILAPPPGQIEQMLPPKRDLQPNELHALGLVAKENPWAERLAEDRRSPVQWIQDHYAAFMDGLLRHHFRHVDKPLYFALIKYAARTNLPEGFDVPTAGQNEIRKRALWRKENPDRLDLETAGRAWDAKRKRKKRGLEP